MKKCTVCNSENLSVSNFHFATSQFYEGELRKLVESQLTDSNEVRCHNCGAVHFELKNPVNSEYYSYLNDNLGTYYPKMRKEYELVLDAIDKNSTIADIGCGSGFFISQAIEKKAHLKKIYALDFYFSQEIVGAEMIKSDLNSEFRVPKVDFVTSFHVIEHVESPSSFIQAICASRSNQIFISTPNSKNYRNVFEIVDYLNYPPHHLTQFSKKSLEKCANEIKEYNFEVHLVDKINKFRQVYRLIKQNKRITFNCFKPLFKSKSDESNYNTLLLHLKLK